MRGIADIAERGTDRMHLVLMQLLPARLQNLAALAPQLSRSVDRAS